MTGSPPAPLPSVTILGVRVHAVTVAQTLDWAAAAIRERAPRQVCTANPEFVMAAQSDREFLALLNTADLVIPDGVGLLWAARWLGAQLPERVAGSDLVGRIAARGGRLGWRVFLLGAAEGVAQRAGDVLAARCPGLVIAGAYSGSPRPEDEAEIVTRVRSARPDVLFVAFGAPAQDKWIARNRQRLGVPVSMGVGGTFDFLAGVAQRAPDWVQGLGLEWLHRLVRQPWRAGRIFSAIVLFPLRVLSRGRRSP
jgi:N-acetylglucosaminyldiphosphoundecaprenol N-acetyl-beta-D-mannosaminyltransferase